MAHNIVSIDPVPEVEILDATPSDTLPSFGRSRHRSNARNAGEMYLATLGSPASVRVVRSKLNCFARFFNYPDIQSCEWELMRYQNVVTFLDHLKSKLEIKQISVVTINAYISAIKGVAQTAWNLNQINDKDLMRIKSIRQLRSSRKIAGKALSITESSAFLSECTGDDQRIIRDRAILLLLLGCGLRRAEITNIEIKNVFLEEARIRLVGKGNKERDVFMNKVVLEAVSLWIEVRRNVISSWNDKYPWKSGNAGDGSSGYLFGRWTRHYRGLLFIQNFGLNQVNAY